jgi:SSS family solute:Na+ symporter
MHYIDLLIFVIYFLAVLGIGFYFFLQNENREDYFVGNRNISSGHIGLSIVATDVGGGFSIGLGGLGFSIGLSGSWLLFTGLIGAWLSAVLIIPRLKRLDMSHGFLTYPDFLRLKYNNSVAVIAALISGIGYLGFTAAQILAGAKLAASSVFTDISFIEPMQFSLYILAVVILLYTVLGGLKAVIYTDTVQWIILISGLLFLGLPVAWVQAGGWETISATLPPEFFRLDNISLLTFLNWMFTILPIWFIAMTIYQRVYACRNVNEAKRAFYLAGLFEYPLMAFVGVGLGMLGRIAFPMADPESAIPLLLKEVLPVGAAGFVLAAYFSAVMSTADSCLIAASGNFTNDIFQKFSRRKWSDSHLIRISQIVTLIVGLTALMLAASFNSVLNLILQTYSFMVSGLLIPTLAAYFRKQPDSTAALVSMIAGAGTTLLIMVTGLNVYENLDPSITGIIISGLAYFIYNNLSEKNEIR